MLCVLSLLWIRQAGDGGPSRVDASAYEAIIHESGMLSNGSFEQVEQDDLPVGWSLSSQGAELTENAYSGQYALSLTGNGAWAQSDRITLRRNTQYTLCARVLVQEGSAVLQTLDGAVSLSPKQTGVWETLTETFSSGDSTSLTVTASVSEGKALFDCLFLQQTDKLYSQDGVSLSSKAKRFSLTTEDTAVTVAVENNRLYMERLQNRETGYEWISADRAQEIPLVSRVNSKAIAWKYQGTETDTSDGTLLRMTFVNASPAMVMTVYWQAYPQGKGPVQYWATIRNKSTATLRFTYSDIVSGDMVITSDGNCTLNRFGRCNHAGADLSSRVYQNVITSGLESRSSVENQHGPEGVLPFQMIQSERGHGLYYGYYWSFGDMTVTTQEDPNQIRIQSVLSNLQGKTLTRSPANGDRDGDGTEDADLDLTVPGMFFGAYQGTMDNGSNRMKDWFWKHRMTETMRENPEEPLIELHLPFNSEEEWSSYLNTHDVASWGVQLIKQDYWWTTPNSPPADGSFRPELDTQWEPYPAKWPNGMVLGELAHKNNLKLSLYMCDTYQDTPLNDWTGRVKNYNALASRLKDWNIDYYRSDLLLEGPDGSHNYAAHEGYLWVLDSLMQDPDLPNFRYEHCSGGGALKDFTTLERMTFMTTEDSARALQHRIVAYANTYMINPVQLKADIAIDWAPTEGTYTDTEAWDIYNFRTGLTGSMMVCSSTTLDGFTDHQIEVAKQTYALYNTKQRAILRNCNTYHILPSPDGIHWDGMEYFNDSIGKGSILLFRPGNQSETQKTVYPDGLKENAVYKVCFEDSPQSNCEKTGGELMEEGVLVTMTREYDSEIIWLEEKDFQPAFSGKYGDLNHDGTINAADALLVLRHSVKTITLPAQDVIAGDVNADGEVNAMDALLILKRAVNKIQSFPCENLG